MQNEKKKVPVDVNDLEIYAKRFQWGMEHQTKKSVKSEGESLLMQDTWSSVDAFGSLLVSPLVPFSSVRSSRLEPGYEQKTIIKGCVHLMV